MFTEKYKVGLIVGDFQLINKIGDKDFIVKCLKCGREQRLTNINKFVNRSNLHISICSKIVIRDFPGGTQSEKLKQFHSIWCNMRTRTTNPKYEKWKNYGGRGISSDYFKGFVDFYDKMYESYLKHIEIYGKANTTLDRIDVNGDYIPQNLRWATWEEQAKNKTNLLSFIAYDPTGTRYEGLNLKEFCESHNISYNLVISGIHQGNLTWKNGWCFKVV